MSQGFWVLQRPFFYPLLKEQMGRPICVLTSDQKRAEGLVQDISFFSADSNSAFLFPEREIMPYDGLEPPLILLVSR